MFPNLIGKDVNWIRMYYGEIFKGNAGEVELNTLTTLCN